MKIDITTTLTGVDGKALNLSQNKPATVGNVASEALLAGYEGDSVEQKLSNYDLFRKIEQADGEVNFTTEEVTAMKNAVGRMFFPLIIGRFRDIVDPVE